MNTQYYLKKILKESIENNKLKDISRDGYLFESKIQDIICQLKHLNLIMIIIKK